MSETAILERPNEGAEDSAKRRQIVEGARAIFLANGFDAASMMDIANKAGVSKGTLYVYFKNKEELFAEIVKLECVNHAEGTFVLDAADHDVEQVLTRIGTNYLNFLCTLEKAATLRIVIAIADRKPEIGKVFYETGPAQGLSRLEAYLKAQVKAGVVAIDDCHLAAAQFLGLCQATLFKPVLFNFAPTPGQKQIKHVVDGAVRVFAAAYRKK
jgi:AcrR family transcriptional regulator